MKVAVIGCTKKKKNCPCKAIEMYSESTLFKKEVAYAQTIGADDIFILSAKYNLIHCNDMIEPYDKSLLDKDMTKDKRSAWAEKSFEQIKERIDPSAEIILLCGRRYYEFLEKMLNDAGYSYNIPMEDVGGIGKKLKWLSDEIERTDPSSELKE